MDRAAQTLDISNLSSQPQFDVVIAGGGISGLYAAWRLIRDWSNSPLLRTWADQRQDGRPRILVLECGDRIGGRIDSRILAGMEHIPAELGAMRFSVTQKLISWLVDHFDLATAIFPMSRNRHFYLRGKHFDEAAIRSGFRVPYDLPHHLRKKTPDELFNWAISQASGYCSGWSPAHWEWMKQHGKYTDSVYDSVALHDIGFWNLLNRTLGNEGYEFARQGGGYDSNTINWNSAEAMPYMLTDFSSTGKYLKLRNGFQCLPEALANEITGSDYPIIVKCRLKRFDQRGKETVCEVDLDGYMRQIATRSLILAMPRRSLELLDQNCEFFADSQVQYLLRSVIPQAAHKFFLAYESRWWDKEAFSPGPTITDLPLHKIYDFGSEEEQGGTHGDKRTLLLASYSDMGAAEDNFWHALEKNIYCSRKLKTTYGDISNNTNPTMCRMAQAQLVEVLQNGEYGCTPSTLLDSYYRDWSVDPYGGGFHAWAAHYRVCDIIRSIRQPRPMQQVYICGEAYSSDQGWVEGALKTTESVLQDFYDLPAAPELPADYPLLTPYPEKPGMQVNKEMLYV